jgi:hypothetical protein
MGDDSQCPLGNGASFVRSEFSHRAKCNPPSWRPTPCASAVLQHIGLGARRLHPHAEADQFAIPNKIFALGSP